MLSEHQMETLEKMFPEGCVTVWVVDKTRMKKQPSGKKFGIFAYNPKDNEDISSVVRLLLERGS